MNANAPNLAQKHPSSLPESIPIICPNQFQLSARINSNYLPEYTPDFAQNRPYYILSGNNYISTAAPEYLPEESTKYL